MTSSLRSQTPPPPYSLESDTGTESRPPLLPPRNTSTVTPNSSLVPMASHQPRPSSTQSLVSPVQDRAGKRRLLLVYVHGFMGDETSFRDFPAHVHNLVAITLSESHQVHTKIYPKYRSRYALEVARDDFSNWLGPHEDPWTDVILLAHSMGGLVAADVALLCRHRIIGTIHFDVPFLGMHPGIIKAGLGSIFKPWPSPEEQGEENPDPAIKKPSRLDTLFNPRPSDPNFNPSFHNDVHLPVRKGWENTLHWLTKHGTNIVQSSKSLVQSHIEFGGAMADYRTLKVRYSKLRALEEDDARKRQNIIDSVSDAPRIRFVNYYTTSTGRPKKPKSPKSPSPSRPGSCASPAPQASASTSLLHLPSQHGNEESLKTIPTGSGYETGSHSDDDDDSNPMQHIQPAPIEDNEPHPPTDNAPTESLLSIDNAPAESNQGPILPEIPPIPQEPPFVDLAQYTDKAQRKSAEKEHDQALKEYQKAVKTRNKVINERHKIEEKWEAQQKKAAKAEKKAHAKALADSESNAQIADEDTGDVQQKKIAEAEKAACATSVIESDSNAQTADEDAGAVQLGASSAAAVVTQDGPYGNYDFSRSTIMNQQERGEQSSYTASSNPPSSYAESSQSLSTVNTETANRLNTPQKKRRLKKFCMLPPEDSNGNKDPTWIKVFMEGIDEVTAHTTLFFVNDTYEQLVGDVGARIEEWVSEADSLRLVRELENL